MSSCASRSRAAGALAAVRLRRGRPVPRRTGRLRPGFADAGCLGAFMDGQFAMSQADPTTAANRFLRALAADPANPELTQQAFVACALSGRPEAVQLARQLPDNQAAQLLLGDTEARAGNWAAAEQRFRALPRQGLTQLLQPLLVAWAQPGAGHTDAAMTTLRPLIDGQRFRGVYALHAAMIARSGRSTRRGGRHYYALAQTEFPGTEPAPGADPGKLGRAQRPPGGGAMHLLSAMAARRARSDHRAARADRRLA